MKIVAISSTAAMQRYALQVWQLLSDSYTTVEGGLHYKSLADLLSSSAQWNVVLHNRRVIAVAVYRA